MPTIQCAGEEPRKLTALTKNEFKQMSFHFETWQGYLSAETAPLDRESKEVFPPFKKVVNTSTLHKKDNTYGTTVQDKTINKLGLSLPYHRAVGHRGKAVANGEDDRVS